MSDEAYKEVFDRRWRTRFPARLSGLFAFYQVLCTLGIVGCEIGSILVDLYNATIYVGFWASIFFTIAWILQIIGATCRCNSTIGFYTLIFQSIALCFAVCMIGFDTGFIIQPATCFFPTTLCNSTAKIRGPYYSEDRVTDIKSPLIKAQLAAGVIMVAFSIDYIIMYIATRNHILKHPYPILRAPTKAAPPAPPKIFKTTSVWYIDENPINNSTLPVMDRKSSAMIDTTFGSSFVTSFNRSRWSAESTDLSPIDV